MNDWCVTYNNSPHFCSRYSKMLSNILWRLCLCEEGFSARNILQRNPKEDQLSNSSSYMLLKSPLLRCQNSGLPRWKRFGDSQPKGKTASHKTTFVAGNAERRVGKCCPAFKRAESHRLQNTHKCQAWESSPHPSLCPWFRQIWDQEMRDRPRLLLQPSIQSKG